MFLFFFIFNYEDGMQQVRAWIGQAVSIKQLLTDVEFNQPLSCCQSDESQKVVHLHLHRQSCCLQAHRGSRELSLWPGSGTRETVRTLVYSQQ